MYRRIFLGGIINFLFEMEFYLQGEHLNYLQN